MKFVVEAYADVPLKFKALDGNVAETCETFNVAELPEQIGALGEIFVFNGQSDCEFIFNIDILRMVKLKNKIFFIELLIFLQRYILKIRHL
jgi:hypothetical protein